ncbi:MAG TPA: hypothetical protein PLJ21_02335, partial [Pseudobdellovibrionaceae bacterium]|nr:hypothetical protein [Pseudobdellovibrionaceae bacterium]
SNPDFLNLLSLSEFDKNLLHKSIPKTIPLNPTTQEELWAQRKKFFFKPMNSYGSKSAYSGNGISSIKFQHLALENTLAQEFSPPGRQMHGDQEFKYDLRFYAYEDQVQLVMGRLYQGQLTNFKTPLGGWACINITDL